MKKFCLFIVFLLVFGEMAFGKNEPFSGPNLKGVKEQNALTSCTIFLLKEADKQINIETVYLDNGEVKVFPVGSNSENIALLVPFGLGQSGDVIQRSVKKYFLVARCQGSEIQLTVRQSDGKERKLPVVKMADWSEYDMRVNVIGADGLKKAFLIRQGQSAEVAGGPVIDMFGGRIPLQKKDYSITTEVSYHKKAPNIEGEAPLTFNGKHLFTKGEINGGGQGDLIVDFGAGSTVISKAFLPPGTEIKKLEGIEYSPSGRRTVAGTVGGFGGNVESFLGKAVILKLKLGNITFRNVAVTVIDKMPNFGKQKTIGILGIDLLRRADVVSVQYSSVTSKSPRLIWGGVRKNNKKQTIRVPFFTAINHIFIKGAVNDIPITFIFDTGASASFLTPQTARRAKLSLSEQKREFRGLDDSQIKLGVSTPKKFTLGGKSFSDIPFYVGDLPVLESLGLKGHNGILGNDFLQRFSEIWLNFEEKTIEFLPK